VGEQLTGADGIQLRELYGMLPIRTDMIFGPDTIERLRTLAREYDLFAYDAAYLELALRRGIGLTTADLKLRSASQKAGVRILRP